MYKDTKRALYSCGGVPDSSSSQIMIVIFSITFELLK